MRTVSYEEFLEFEPCWLGTRDGAEKLERIGRRKERWTALDVLDLPEEEVSAKDKFWAVLREEFIEAEILHEFACRCAEQALVRNPDPRSVAAIEAKRRWLRGEIGDDELRKAWVAAWDVVLEAARGVAWVSALVAWNAAGDDARNAAWEVAWEAAWAAAWAAAREVARDAALGVAGVAARVAAWNAARDEAWNASRTAQVAMLRELLANGAGKKEVSR